jgi:hypothetical protein
MRWQLLRISPEQIPTGSEPVRIRSKLLGISLGLPAICAPAMACTSARKRGKSLPANSAAPTDWLIGKLGVH